MTSNNVPESINIDAKVEKIYYVEIGDSNINMMSKTLVVVLVLATLLASNLVTDGEAAETRKDAKVDHRSKSALL